MALLNRKMPKFLLPGAGLHFVVMVLFCAAAVTFQQYYLAAAELAITLGLFIYYYVASARQKKEILKYFQSTTASLETAFKNDVPFPMAIVSILDGKIQWSNSRFAKVTGTKASAFDSSIHSALPDFSLKWLAEGKAEAPTDYLLEGRRYRVVGNQIHDAQADSALLLATIYLLDVTELLDIRDTYQRSRPVVGIILIDNYDELIHQQTDGAISNLDGSINDCLTKWTADTGGLLRKLERNRYIYIFEAKDLVPMTQGKFSVLEYIRTVTNKNGLAATISMGIGKDGDHFVDNFNHANLAIEMSLSRGGDQAVIKDRTNFTFFGGKTKETERRTKVKSRVIANSLMELIGQSSNVLIMGHKNADLDAIGAAVGVFSMCRKKGCGSFIVVSRQANQAEDLIQMVETMPDYAHAFISPEDAMLMADSRTLLVVVDTNRPDQVESLPLLQSVPRVAVIDHHRRAADYIEHVALNFHETFASSASELVTELLQYAVETNHLLPLEAQALLAGIVLDTKNFNLRTGSRTFEAAAFLRHCGADTVEVKKLFQSDLAATVDRYRIIQAARLYRGEIGIAALEYTADRISAAKAADELLNISNISTSFVLYPDGNRVMISARSIGDINVQMILEPLGGGGNGAAAGAQVQGRGLTQVLKELVQSIDQYFDN